MVSVGAFALSVLEGGDLVVAERVGAWRGDLGASGVGTADT